MSDCTVCFNDYHCLYTMNAFKIDGSTMRNHSSGYLAAERTYSSEFLVASRPKLIDGH